MKLKSIANLLILLIAGTMGFVPCLTMSTLTEEIEIQGASIVSDDGWFTFFIENNLNENITVHFLNHSMIQRLEPNDSLTIRVVLTTKVNVPARVNYVFEVTYHSSNKTKEYVKTVTVVPSGFVRTFDEMTDKLRLYTFFLIITTSICIFLGSAYIIEQVFRFVKFIKGRRR